MNLWSLIICPLYELYVAICLFMVLYTHFMQEINYILVLVQTGID